MSKKTLDVGGSVKSIERIENYCKPRNEKQRQEFKREIGMTASVMSRDTQLFLETHN